MSLRVLKWLTIVLPPLLIGGFEFIRHEFLLSMLTMDAGNWVITILTLLLSFLFSTWMFRQIEQTNHRLAGERAARAVYEERERMAQELHDNIAQVLFFMNVQLSKGQIDEARSAVSELDHHVRQAIFNLRTDPSEGSDFITRLQVWLEEWSAISGISVDTHFESRAAAQAAKSEIALFSLIREAFTNIRKHSCAEQAAIHLLNADSNAGWELRITDNGRGFTEDKGSAGRQHWGLDYMRKSAKELGARLVIRAREPQGTEIIVSGGQNR